MKFCICNFFKKKKKTSMTKEEALALINETSDKLHAAGWSAFLFAVDAEFGEAKHIPLIKDVAYSKESYADEYRAVMGAVILETINYSKLGIFHRNLMGK